MEYELVPKLLPGKLIEVTEIGVKIELKGRMGIIIVPLRCVITDKPLAVDADGAAGSDGFGLEGNRNGRDLLNTGNGGGAYYSGLLQRQFFEALSRNRKVLKDDFRVVVKVWIGDDGRVQKAEVVNGSGNVQVDDLIRVTLLEMNPLKDVPPSSMRPIQLRLSNRS